jgi:hypothetical protein
MAAKGASDGSDTGDQRPKLDEIGHGLSDRSYVWKVYEAEAKEFDSDLKEGWKDSIDVLLVFVSLALDLLSWLCLT